MDEILKVFEDWNWGALRPDQILLLIVAGAALLILLGIWLLVRRRRRNVRAALGVKPELCLGRNPCFYKVVTTLGRRGLAIDLGRLEGTEEARRILQESGRNRSKKRPSTSASSRRIWPTRTGRCSPVSTSTRSACRTTGG